MLQLIIDHGAELVLHGHGHRAHYDELATSQGMAPVIAVPSASAMGLHGGNAAAYNCYQVTTGGEGWQLQVRSRQYQPESKTFAETDIKTVCLVRRP